jgi:hypothetical protein
MCLVAVPVLGACAAGHVCLVVMFCARGVGRCCSVLMERVLLAMCARLLCAVPGCRGLLLTHC